MNNSFIDMIAKKYEDKGDAFMAKLIKSVYLLGYADAGGRFKVAKSEQTEEELPTEFINEGRD